MAQKIDWLQDWEETFDWKGLSETEIAKKQQSIQDYATAWLEKMDEAWQLRHPSAKAHKIKFSWFGTTTGQSYFVVAYLTPSAKKDGKGGGGGSLISPTPPPQP